MATRTWFITGTSRGFGREWASVALARGDRVAGTARDPRTLDDLAQEYCDALLPMALDVTNRETVFETVRSAHEHFGALDIVVNNAGYGQFGMVEELSEREAREQIETNLFGALWVTQAALPVFRAQRSGHFLQVSSIGGISAFAGIGMYHVSKWALEGISQSLAQEVSEFRDQSHVDRARRVLDRLGRLVREARRTARGLQAHTRSVGATSGRQSPR